MTIPQTSKKRPGDLRQDTNRTATTSHLQEEAVMTNNTAPDLSGEWHPLWCDQSSGGCGPKTIAEAMHEGFPERLEFEEHNTDGTEFAVEARRYFLESPDLAQFPHDYGFRLTFHGIADADPVLNPDRMRDLADWLFTEADRLDHWREQQNAEVSRG